MVSALHVHLPTKEETLLTQVTIAMVMMMIRAMAAVVSSYFSTTLTVDPSAGNGFVSKGFGGTSGLGDDNAIGGFGNKGAFETAESNTIEDAMENDAKKDVGEGADDCKANGSDIDAFTKEPESATPIVRFLQSFLSLSLLWHSASAQTGDDDDKDMTLSEGGAKENEVKLQVLVESEVVVESAEKGAQGTIYGPLHTLYCRRSTNGRNQHREFRGEHR